MSTYVEGDNFHVCDLSSPFHEWEGTVLEVVEGGYGCMVIRFKGQVASITIMITNYEKKQIECDDCGRVTEVPKSMTLKRMLVQGMRKP
jgi:hypothetical protein